MSKPKFEHRKEVMQEMIARDIKHSEMQPREHKKQSTREIEKNWQRIAEKQDRKNNW